MASIVVVCLVLLVTVYSVWCIRLIDHNELSEKVEKLPCGEPQPRAFRISELTNEALEFVDSFVVLNRCDRAGCCLTEQETCTAKEIERVNLTLEYFDDYSDYLHVIAENHVSCHCSSASSPIK